VSILVLRSLSSLLSSSWAYSPLSMLYRWVLLTPSWVAICSLVRLGMSVIRSTAWFMRLVFLISLVLSSVSSIIVLFDSWFIWFTSVNRWRVLGVDVFSVFTLDVLSVLTRGVYLILYERG